MENRCVEIYSITTDQLNCMESAADLGTQAMTPLLPKSPGKGSLFRSLQREADRSRAVLFLEARIELRVILAQDYILSLPLYHTF